MRIDVHGHYFPDAYLTRLERLGGRDTHAALAAPGARLSIDERLALMGRVGIDLQVLSLGQQAPYLEDAAGAAEAARLGNDLYAELCQRQPGRFAAFGSLPLPHVDAALAELGRCLDTLGMVGITIGCSVAGRPVDDPSFEPLYAELDRRRAVLFLHPMGVGAGPHTADHGLSWMIGAPVEDTVAALRLILSGLTSRYPGIRVIVPHIGGVLPLLVERLDDQAERLRLRGEPLALVGALSSHLQHLWFDTVNSHPAALRCARESFGAARLMLGTDFPYLAGARFERCVTYVQEALSAQDAETVLDRTAPALLGLGPEHAA